eukprot:TRINITY_DN24536_c0_g1_i1.p2 TRINITY_DN24536_c0_g1~~TRINITY_DN24536_c0_g1_i1.p2  ORF type:complete len:255 (+),score=86.85 TRINITY_DN24536_c0_g1_i1:65-829(+)
MDPHQTESLLNVIRHRLEMDKPDDPVEYIARFMKTAPRPKLVIQGPPASGKGTQCEKLLKQLGVVHISTGDILREQIAKNTWLGREAQRYIKDGQLVPDQLVIDLVKKRLNEPDCKRKGWMLDGFPRTASQARIMIRDGIVPDCIVKLVVPDDVIINRIGGRRIDPKTTKVYHLVTKPPPPGLKVVQRPDDTPEAILKRLKTYHDTCDAIEAEYPAFCPVFPVTGNSADGVNRDALAAIQKHRWGKLLPATAKL